MKVLFVSSGNCSQYSNLNGINPIIVNQANSLSKKSVQIDFYPVKGHGFKSIIPNIIKLRKKINTNDIDLIHAHYSISAFISLLAKKRNIPLVISYMGSDLYGDFNSKGKRKTSSFPVMMLSFVLQFFANKIIVKSKDMLKYILFKSKTNVIPNGVDQEKFKPIDRIKLRQALSLPDDKKNILFLGDPLNERKNFSLAEKAISKLGNDFNLVYPYPIKNEIVPEYLNGCDVLLLTSYAEGSPNVLKEAMFCNIPIVSTDVGDAKEVLENVDGCFICNFSSMNVSESIKEAIRFERTRGREQKQELREDKIADKIITIYNSIITI